MKNPNGYILWEGLSRLDHKTPVVVIATGFKNATSNPKTGNMIQTWIICSDIHPTEAINGGEDRGICGECPHRKIDGKRTCYVNQMSIAAIYRTYKAGKYPRVSLYDLFKGRKVRIGSYGEPTAVPFGLWKNILHYSSSHTGYTHQWKTCDINFRDICMASVDNEEERVLAQSDGWRTFRVVVPDEELTDREIRCPNEVNSDIQCNRCNLCMGRSNTNVRSIAITVHGVGAKYFRESVDSTVGTG